jgi:hypothetical protein
MLGFRPSDPPANTYARVERIIPGLILNSYLHAGGFQEEQAIRFYASTLRQAGYNVWWVIFDHATPRSGREHGYLLPWHHIEGGMRLVFPSEEARMRALATQSSRGAPRVTLADMGSFVRDFTTMLGHMQTTFSLSMQTLQGMYMDLPLTPPRAQHVRPTQLTFEDGQLERAVVFFPSTAQVQVITNRLGNLAGPIADALATAAGRAGFTLANPGVLLSYYPDTNVWYPDYGFAVIFTDTAVARAFGEAVNATDRSRWNPVAALSGGLVTPSSQPVRVCLASTLLAKRQQRQADTEQGGVWHQAGRGRNNECESGTPPAGRGVGPGRGRGRGRGAVSRSAAPPGRAQDLDSGQTSQKRHRPSGQQETTQGAKATQAASGSWVSCCGSQHQSVCHSF